MSIDYYLFDMASRRQLFFLSLGVLTVVLLVGVGIFTVFQIQLSGGEVSDAESYPVGPEKPTPLNSSNVVNYTTTYEERLFYNDLLASHDHRLHDDESVVTNCTSHSVSSNRSEEFHVQLECRGGVTDSSQLTESEEFTYSVAYQITNDTTQQTEFQNYPFRTDRKFNNERN